MNNKNIKQLIVLVMLITAVVFPYIIHAETSSSDDSSINVYSAIGLLGMRQSSTYIELDSLFSDGDISKQCSADGNVEASTGFFEFVDFTETETTELLSWLDEDNKYFVVKYPQKVDFGALYCDKYRDEVAVSTGYPRVSYKNIRKDGETVEIGLDKVEEKETGWVYKKEQLVEPGIYEYKYCVRNVNYPGEYTLETSSFVVSHVPQKSGNISIKDGAIVSNARVLLEWEVASDEEYKYTYKLYLWEENGVREAVYEGEEASYEAHSLKYGTKYYWEVETINQYGVSSLSERYTFTTIKAVEKPFNYPNPFNPNRETTNIVFHVENDQEVRIKIYSEYGDIIYSTAQNAVKGANEFKYNGKDERGRTLYNGSYICRIETAEGEKACYLLIIK